MLKFTKQITLEAGELVKKFYYSKDLIIENKSEKDLVTEADKACEDFLVKKILDKFPTHQILCEEGHTNNNATSEYKWIIDPIDGTTNFAHRLPVFGISIALEYKQEIIIGIVYNPISRELFYAEKNKGAYKEIILDKIEGPFKLEVSKNNKLKTSLLATGFHPGYPEIFEENLDHFKKFFKASHTIRRFGAASIDLAYTASGFYEGYWELKLKPWDMAAGILLVTEAGGKITNLDGSRFSIYEESMLATNKLIHSQMLDILTSN